MNSKRPVKNQTTRQIMLRNDIMNVVFVKNQQMFKRENCQLKITNYLNGYVKMISHEIGG